MSAENKISYTLLVKLYVKKYVLEGREKANAWCKKHGFTPELYAILRPKIKDELKKRGVK